MPTYKSSQPSARPEFVEPGEYTAEVIDAVETVSSGGNEMIELKLRIEPSGLHVYDNLVFTERAFWKIDMFRAATGEEVVADEEVEIIADNLIGKRGQVRLVVEEYNGRKRNKVAGWVVHPNTNTESDDDIAF